MYLPMYVSAVALLAMNIFYYAYGFFAELGLQGEILDYFIFDVTAKMGLLRNQFQLKLIIILVLILCQVVKAGKALKDPWRDLIIFLAVSLVLFMWPIVRMESFAAQGIYAVTSTFGFILTGIAIGRIGRKIKGLNGDILNDAYETFAQCNEKIETEYSINIPTLYQYQHRKRRGWINVVNPFRATFVFGTPGSGKSYSVYNPYIEQMIKKGYTMFLYDYKYPDLTQVVYNTFLENKDVYRKKYGKEPRFCILNFNDPRYSMRCNPIHPRYINDPADTSEIADIIMRNVNPQSIEKEDFFSLSAKVYIDALILFLRKHQDGRFCTFPHLIELMGRNYKAVFKMLQKYDEIRVKMTPFQNALKGNAQEQLQGQIASAQIPLMRFASPALYWVLSGDDFSLDLNDPDSPAILCVGNDPDRQNIYGTTLALYTSRMFREINHKGKLPCAVLLDELPTIFIKGLDNLIATARSNKVAIVLGAQDKSQLIRDYSDKEAEVIFNTVGNIFAGQVNGRTAKELAETFGREFRQQQSETTGGENDTTNTSYQQQEILPQSRIETLTQGYFFGKVADNNDTPIKRKLFCGEIQIDNEGFKERQKHWVKIPKQQTNIFNEGGIEREVRENAKDECREYIYLELSARERADSLRNEYYTPIDTNKLFEIACEMYDALVREKDGDSSLSEEIVARYARPEEGSGMADDMRVMREYFAEIRALGADRLLDRVVAKMQKEHIDEIVKQNYKRIQDEVESIFEAEGVKEFEEEETAGRKKIDPRPRQEESRINSGAPDRDDSRFTRN